MALGYVNAIKSLYESFIAVFQVLLFGFPLQMILVKVMFGQRRKGVALTDQRVRLTTEVCTSLGTKSTTDVL